LLSHVLDQLEDVCGFVDEARHAAIVGVGEDELAKIFTAARAYLGPGRVFNASAMKSEQPRQSRAAFSWNGEKPAPIDRGCD